MTSLNFSITMESADEESLRTLSMKTGGWSDTNMFFMESRPRLSMFKKEAKKLKLVIKEIEESKYSDYGEELSTKIIFPKSLY